MTDDDNTAIVSVELSSVPETIDDYSKFEYSPGAKSYLSAIIGATSIGLVSVTPLVCKGSQDCPFSKRCPIWMADGDSGNYPVGKQCVVELNLAREKFAAYVQEFDLEDAVKTSPTLRAQISKLAELDVLDYRASLILAGVTGDSDGSLLIEQVVAVDRSKEGEISEICQLQEHPAWRVKERIQKQRSELLDMLCATPRRKIWADVALKRAERDNIFEKQMELLERVGNIVDAMDKDDD
jgi:hypothetical protein